jgi:hypothetical protein
MAARPLEEGNANDVDRREPITGRKRVRVWPGLLRSHEPHPQQPGLPPVAPCARRLEVGGRSANHPTAIGTGLSEQLISTGMDLTFQIRSA